MQSQQSDSVSGRRRTVLKPVIEHQAVWTDRIAEVIGVEALGAKVDQFPVMRRGQYDVRLRRA